MASVMPFGILLMLICSYDFEYQALAHFSLGVI